MTDPCCALGCGRLSTSRVPVFYDPFDRGLVLSRSGKTEFLAAVCPGHEQELAEGKLVPLARSRHAEVA